MGMLFQSAFLLQRCPYWLFKLVNKIAHKKHGGNSFGVFIEDKILKFEEDGKNFIFEVKDICPSLTI